MNNDDNVHGNNTDETIQSVFSALSSLSVPCATSSMTDINNRNAINRLKYLTETSKPHAKHLFFTLHCLFPHELIPALDLLDRKLVAKLVLDVSSTQWPADRDVFYVQSASVVTEARTTPGTTAATTTGPFPMESRTSTATSRFRNALKATSTYYEVRLDVWNCSCTAFAYSAFTLLTDSPDEVVECIEKEPEECSSGKEAMNEKDTDNARFGGLLKSRKSPRPVCKHILAALLGTAASNLFGDGIVGRVIGRDEMAAWGAGWGDHG